MSLMGTERRRVIQIVGLAVVVCVLSFLAVAAWWTWNLTRPLPTDRSLKVRFQEHRQDFDSLVWIARADTRLVGASHDWMLMRFDMFVHDTPQHDRMLMDWEVSGTGRSIYRKLLDRAGVPGLSRRDDGIWFVVVASRGARKGYVYSEKPLSPVHGSLDGLEKARYFDVGFVSLAPHWYLFLEPSI